MQLCIPIKKLSAFLLLAIAFVFFVNEAFAVSFDCGKARSEIERLICSDPKLSALDDELARVYKDALGRASDRAALKKEQRQWLKEVRNSLETSRDIEATYRARIEEIGLPAGLLAAVHRYVEKRGDHEWPCFRHAMADLDDDGRADAIVLLTGADWCGSGGCTMLVFRGKEKGFTFVSGSTITFEPVRVSPEKTEGWKNLIVYSKGEGNVVMRFDGKRYPPDTNSKRKATPAQVRAAQTVMEEVTLSSLGASQSDSPEEIVRRLYKNDIPDYGGLKRSQYRAVLSRYFDVPLVELFLRIRECEIRERGDVCGPDFMLLYDAQDSKITDLKVGAFDGQKNMVEVMFRNFGKSDVIVFVMRKTPAGWRISDIRYPSGHSLLKMLKGDLEAS